MNSAGTLSTVDGRNRLRFVRPLPHPPERVWRSLTDHAELTLWFPAHMDMTLAVGEKIRFTFPLGQSPNGTGPVLDGEILELEPERLFAYEWGDDLLRFEIGHEVEGCVLTFTFDFDDRARAAGYATGWHNCLDALERVLADEPLDMEDHYAERHEEYARAFELGTGAAYQHETGGEWTVRFVRELPFSVETVWRELVENAVITVGGPPPLRITNGYVPAGTVTEFQMPVMLEYSWYDGSEPAGLVRWELSASAGGVRLIITQTIPDALGEQRYLTMAAWHTHIELLADHLLGNDRVPWPQERTDELMTYYAAMG